MKKLFVHMAIITLLALPIVSFAADFRAGDSPRVDSGEVVSGDLYMAGGSVSNAGDILGDFIAGGRNILISGNVGADVIAAGGDVSILGAVADDVRVAGGNIIISGSVAGDVIAGGGEISIGGSGVGGDAIIGGGNVRINAPVAGKLSFGGHSIFINSPIGGDIKIEADSVTLGSKAVISGNMTYSAKTEMAVDAGAIVTGKINFNPQKEKMSVPAFAPILLFLMLGKFFALLVCALVVGLGLRRYVKDIINIASEKPAREFGRGLIILIALPIISGLLCMTLVGAPLGILGFLFFAVGLLMAWIITPIILGSVVYRYFSKKELEVSAKTIILGVLVYALIGLVPFVGWLVLKLLFILSLGAMDWVNWQMLKGWR